jgi:oxaloacetate decarboxylase gamma subunit
MSNMESINELLLQGVELMLIGMGVVFSFLLLLVALTNLMGKLVSHVNEQPAVAARLPLPANVVSEAGNDEVPPHTLKAIQLAIHQYRNKNHDGQSH